MDQLENELMNALSGLQDLDDRIQLRIGKWAATERLLELGEYESIADFGCGDGWETIALVMKLNASVAIGIDKEQTLIDTARIMVDEICRQLEANRQLVSPIRAILANPAHFSHLSVDVRSKAISLINKYEKLSLPSYQRGDITNGEKDTGLPPNHFALVFCKDVLYHIYCAENSPTVPIIRAAIQEVARVAKPGGLVAIDEPYTCSPNDDRQVELKSYFLQAGLHPIRENDPSFEGIELYLKLE